MKFFCIPILLQCVCLHLNSGVKCICSVSIATLANITYLWISVVGQDLQGIVRCSLPSGRSLKTVAEGSLLTQRAVTETCRFPRLGFSPCTPFSEAPPSCKESGRGENPSRGTQHGGHSGAGRDLEPLYLQILGAAPRSRRPSGVPSPLRRLTPFAPTAPRGRARWSRLSAAALVVAARCRFEVAAIVKPDFRRMPESRFNNLPSNHYAVAWRCLHHRPATTPTVLSAGLLARIPSYQRTYCVSTPCNILLV